MFRRTLATIATVAAATIVTATGAFGAPGDSTTPSTAPSPTSSSQSSSSTTQPPTSTTTTQTTPPGSATSTTSAQPSTSVQPSSSTTVPPTSTTHPSGHNNHPQPPPHGGHGEDSNPPAWHDGEFHPDDHHPAVAVSVQVVVMRMGNTTITNVTVNFVKQLTPVFILIDGGHYEQITVILQYNGTTQWCDGYFNRNKEFVPLAIYPSSVQTPEQAVSTPDNAKILPSDAVVTGNNPETSSWKDNLYWEVPVGLAVIAGLVILGWWLLRRPTRPTGV